MKFLVFSDTHDNKKPIAALLKRAKEEDIDFVICAGDFSEFGRGAVSLLKKFNAIGKKMYVIPGNHEEGGGYTKLVSGYENIIDVDRKDVKIGGYRLLGYGGDGFTLQDPEFRKKDREWYGKYNGEKIILLLHGPPSMTKLDEIKKGHHVGNIDYRRFIERVKPKLVICGHLHETAGMVDKVGKTKMVNACWDGMVIELK